jgi:hypothetical protein
MKKPFKLFLLTAASIIAVLGLTAFSPAQEKSVPRSKQAITVPISDNVITLNITLNDGTPIQAGELEGGLIRIERDGRVFGLVPRIIDRERSVIGIDIFRITRIKRGDVTVGESIEQIETIDTNPSNARPTNVESQMSIQLKSIKKRNLSMKEHKAQGSGTISPQNEPDPTERCCVTCGGLKVCGCAVVMSCGSCCCGTCCE